MVYVLFFLSGVSGLIYQVVWVRVFANVFGNTIYSASLIVAVFMLGLGVGAYIIGAWADRRYAARPVSLLRTYGYVELLIGILGLGISTLLPNLGPLSARLSSYVREPSCWFVLSSGWYLAQLGMTVVLLTPITLLMGGTLTLLIRHLVRRDVAADSWRIAVLYGINTAGAALGCFLTDFSLVPTIGLRDTQITAAVLNLVAAAGAFAVAWAARPAARAHERGGPGAPAMHQARSAAKNDSRFATATIGMALAMSGFAAMGMEIVWFRHFSILLGGFRAVFSLLLTVVLLGIGVGSIASAWLQRRSAAAASSLMFVQALFVASTLAGLALANGQEIDRIVRDASGADVDVLGALAAGGWTASIAALWFDLRPMLLEVAVPAVLMGFSFPLANAVVQRHEHSVGRRAGLLYLANTAGAVCGSLAAGFLFLPTLGMQGSAAALMIAAAAGIVLLHVATRTRRTPLATAVVRSLLLAAGSIAIWLLLPSGHVLARALPAPVEHERLLARSEGLTEVISVVERRGRGRTLLTNGHPMSSTAVFSQRYMRALAHIPLLSMDRPQSVLVIGFGVGNTAHAATLHPSIRRVEVADLSRDILAYADEFRDANHGVLRDRRVAVFVNDGRHHLQMQRPESYDLITLEPPPVAYAGVAALYSREFYQLARTRLTARGYMSQWLPAYQVPTATTLAMIRAFIDVFPNSVLLSGAQADLLLVGTAASRIEIDPDRAVAVLSNAPALRADLARLNLGSVREIVGTFLGSASTLASATADASPATDDRPMQEYGSQSSRGPSVVVPPGVVDLSGVAEWCRGCFENGRVTPVAKGLDTYLALLDLAYSAPPADVLRARALGEQGRLLEGSAYLGSMVPESAAAHNYIGIEMARNGELDAAIAEFNRSLQLEPDSAATHWHLGVAFAETGDSRQAAEHLRRSLELDPANAQVRADLAQVMALQRRAQVGPGR